jgi:hypothetical protein
MREYDTEVTIGGERWTIRFTPLRMRIVADSNGGDSDSLIDYRDRDILVSTSEGLALGLHVALDSVAKAAKVMAREQFKREGAAHG